METKRVYGFKDSDYYYLFDDEDIQSYEKNEDGTYECCGCKWEDNSPEYKIATYYYFKMKKEEFRPMTEKRFAIIAKSLHDNYGDTYYTDKVLSNNVPMETLYNKNVKIIRSKSDLEQLPKETRLWIETDGDIYDVSIDDLEKYAEDFKDVHYYLLIS